MRVVLFGLGMIYNKYNKYVDKSTIVSLADNDVEKQGTLVNGCKVKSPASIGSEDFDYVIIMSKSIKNMQNQLLEYGISDKKIRTYKDIGDLYKLPIIVYCENTQCLIDKWIDNHKHNKKIFIMSHAMNRSGVPVALMNMSVLLKKLGWEVLYGSYDQKDNLSQELEKNKIDYIENIELISRREDFEKLLKNFDVIVVGTLVLADAAQQYINYDIPIVWWIHECQDEYYQQCVLPREKTNIYYYGVGSRVIKKFNEYYPNENINELLYFTPSIECYEKEKNKKLIFGLIGWYSIYKAYDVFIKAFELIPDGKKDNAEVYMICPGFDLAENDVKERVRSIPQLHVLSELTQEEVKKFYKAIDVFICASRDDSMPIVVTEAMQNRIPCIVSNHVGQSVYMENNYGGYVFESENADELAKLMIYCIDNKETVLEKGEEAYNIYSDKFSERVAEKSVSRVMNVVLKDREAM
jgi:glycosyltransferase involved in cell wall biosynthesis